MKERLPPGEQVLFGIDTTFDEPGVYSTPNVYYFMGPSRKENLLSWLEKDRDHHGQVDEVTAAIFSTRRHEEGLKHEQRI